MPECRSAGSLQEVCLQAVGSNMDFWCKNFAENYQVMKTFKYFIGPFDDMSSDVSKMLLEHLMHRGNLKRPYLCLLMNHSLVNLDLSGCPMLVKDDIINAAMLRCKGLKFINLRNCIQVKKETLVALSETYPKIVSLDLSGTRCAQEAAKAVFKNCTQVKDLILSHCLLDDDDLSVLIESVKDKGTHKNLRRFCLHSTNVSHRALTLVLHNLSWITMLEHRELVESIGAWNEEVEKTSLDTPGGSERKKNTTLKLRSLILDETIHIYSHIHCFKLCPQLVKIELIKATVLDNKCFTAIGNLAMLRDLKIVCHRHSEIDFTDVLQALTKIGSNLQILVLEDVDGLDLLKTVQLAANVIELSLIIHDSQMSFYSEPARIDIDHPLKEMSLPKLKEVKVGGNGEESITQPVLTRFLSACCVVEKLTIIQLDELTDTVLQEMFKVNELTHLTLLEVFACRNITNDSLEELILSPLNKLSTVKIMDCWNIMRKDYSNWLATAKKQNYNLEIDWN